MTKEVDLPSAWGHTPLRGFQFARVALKEQDKMRGGFFAQLLGALPGLRGSAWHRFFLFCFVRSLGGEKKKKKKEGKKEEGRGRSDKRREKREGCVRGEMWWVRVVGTGGTSVGRGEMGWEMGVLKQRITRLSQTGVKGWNKGLDLF